MVKAKTSLLQVRIDTELKQETEKLFAEIGLDTPSAVRLFFKQSVMRKAIPFAAALREGKNEKSDEPVENPFHPPLYESVRYEAVRKG
jgi:DNA-damage-inducible protein J